MMFYNCKSLNIINHGEMCEAEVTDGVNICNYNELENILFAHFKDDMPNGTMKEFSEWMQTKDAIELAEDTFNEIYYM